MPTVRPRHMVTESDELAEALDVAAERWPELSRAQLIAKLAIEGHHADREAHRARRQARLEAVHRHSGALTGAYGDGYLRTEREGWPD